MPWFRVDDDLAFHPKAIAAGNAALGLWVRAGAYAAQYLTEGFLPRGMVAGLDGNTKAARALVDAGLWVEVDGGYRFHQWEDRQPTKAQVEADRAAAAERQRNARERARESREQSRRDSRGESRPQSRSPRPGPALPKEQVQTPPNPSGSAPPGTATRLPDDFAPDDRLLAWVRANCPDVPASENDRFVDHWRAAPGAKARKRDWPATWRNWMRRAQDDIRSGRRPAAGPKRSTSDERVAQAQSLRAKYAELDAADGIATVTQLAIGGTA